MPTKIDLNETEQSVQYLHASEPTSRFRLTSQDDRDGSSLFLINNTSVGDEYDSKAVLQDASQPQQRNAAQSYASCH